MLNNNCKKTYLVTCALVVMTSLSTLAFSEEDRGYTVKKFQSDSTVNSVWQMKADEIVGKDVYNSENDKNVGEIKKIVSDPSEGNKLVAVVAVDQLLDIVGGKEVIVPLDDFNFKEDMITIPQTEKQLKNYTEYKDGKYYDLQLTNRPLSEIKNIME